MFEQDSMAYGTYRKSEWGRLHHDVPIDPVTVKRAKVVFTKHFEVSFFEHFEALQCENAGKLAENNEKGQENDEPGHMSPGDAEVHIDIPRVDLVMKL